MNTPPRIEYATDQDKALNYCLWEYERPASAEDKLRSVNLLYRSFMVAGADARAYAVVDAIRDAIGPFRTVFGIKWADGKLAWEFYFYDYSRLSRNVSMTRVLSAVRPWLPCAVVPNESSPYFMFSLDMNDDLLTGRGALDVVHMYVGNPGSTVSSGISYAVRADTITLENLYFFFDAVRDAREVGDKVACSAVFDKSQVSIDGVLVPELRGCKTICIANKQTRDCAYFSGVNVEQLLWFLRTRSWPGELTEYVTGNRTNFDHLLFDVGFDYRSDGRSLSILKYGLYGVF
jgi:hypothetical protein